MILPAAASLLLLTQAPASTPSRADGGAATARVSSLARRARARTAPGAGERGAFQVPPDFEAWLAPYTEVRSALLADPGDDGKALLILTRFSSVNQIHRVTAPLGAREQLTFGKEPVSKARWLPGDSRTVFFLQDVGGREAFQLYRLDTRTGQRQVLTDGKSRHETFTLSRDGRRLAYSGTGRNGTDTDVYLAEVASPSTAQSADRGSRNLASGGLLARRRAAAGEADEGHRRLGPLGRGSEDEGAHPGDAGRGHEGQGLAAARGVLRRRARGLPRDRPGRRVQPAASGRTSAVPRRPGRSSPPTSPGTSRRSRWPWTGRWPTR